MRYAPALPFLILVAVAALAGCGFTPLYAKPDPSSVGASGGFDTVGINSIPDRSGQYLRNALIDRMYGSGRPEHPRYTLAVNTIQESKADLDLTKDSTVTRRQVHLTTHMTLTDTTTGQTVLERDLTAVNSFNVLLDQYDTTVSEQEVRQNALDDLARQIEAQLALYLKRPRA